MTDSNNTLQFVSTTLCSSVLNWVFLIKLLFSTVIVDDSEHQELFFVTKVELGWLSVGFHLTVESTLTLCCHCLVRITFGHQKLVSFFHISKIVNNQKRSYFYFRPNVVIEL